MQLHHPEPLALAHVLCFVDDEHEVVAPACGGELDEPFDQLNQAHLRAATAVDVDGVDGTQQGRVQRRRRGC